jgi:hypothetical protein
VNLKEFSEKLKAAVNFSDEFQNGMQSKLREFPQRETIERAEILSFYKINNLRREPFGFDCARLVPDEERAAVPAHVQFQTIYLFNR